jgi:hypothetical protein
MHELWAAAIIAVMFGGSCGALCWLLRRSSTRGDAAARQVAARWEEAAQSWERANLAWVQARNAWQDTLDTLEGKSQ